MAKKRLLLHACCGPCSTQVIETLKPEFDVTLFFYNPNIYPQEEYRRRLSAMKKVAKEWKLSLIVEEHNPKIWMEYVKGAEKEPEGGKRCELCFRHRLEKTAEFAKKNNYDFFGTTLTISPSKDSTLINEIGKKLQQEYKVDFLERDFKKNDGYNKSVEFSKNLGLYRQKYCGCEYSMNIYSISSNEASPNE